MPTQLQLYNYFRSSASYRVRIALTLKGIDYEYVPVHLLNHGGEQNQAAYAQQNPMKQVPTLTQDGLSLGQSMAILDYLDHEYPEPVLFPKDHWRRAKVIEICEVINSGIQPMVNLSVQKWLSTNGFDDSKMTSWNQHWTRKGLSAVEQSLSQTTGPFCFGDTVSAADVLLIPQLFSAQRLGVEAAEFPQLALINEHCLSLEAFKKAHPAHQPDSPRE